MEETHRIFLLQFYGSHNRLLWGLNSKKRGLSARLRVYGFTLDC